MLENGLALTCLALVWWKNARVFLYLQMCVWVNVCICEAECPNRMCQPIHIIKVVLCVHNFQASSSLLNGQEITGARHTLHLVEFICECVCVFFLTRIFLHSISFHWNHYGVLDTGSHEICHFVYLRFCVFTFAACVFFCAVGVDACCFVYLFTYTDDESISPMIALIGVYGWMCCCWLCFLCTGHLKIVWWN